MFDSHAHYDDARFDGIRHETLLEVHESGVEKIANIASSLASSKTCIELAEKYGFIYASVGIHPSDAVKDMRNENYISLLEEMYNSSKKVVAIGEIGLDYHYGKDDKEEQKICFDKQMSLAKKLGCPVIIHDREAHEETLEILSAYPEVKGVLHSFSGSFEMAKQVLKMGYYISINGVITFENAKKTVDIVTNIRSIMPGAESKILMETDCPYLTPVPFRGKTNRSDLMVYTAEKAASCLGITTEEFCELTYNNACRFYGISEQKEKL
ncbi:MAG: TatD family hydrolase [Clostridia bacterium]|nr:TatD family hydrolase [Clostridia bacterium]